ncbi:transcriptional regulator [Thermocladium modestius]|uniref:Transcriptional regulator n=1 Tax=Thermocladium modestius TaxID=62609 RepID=A0A830GVA8_9CREN|nr:sulfurtransferase TusA family protein [Thermocladium modestius]GGP22028.1 transcriptional regulator [Thermocladium modestius]
MTQPSRIVDARGLSCPGPITELVKAYRNSRVGDVIEVLATDEGFKQDVQAWIRKTGNELLELKEDGGEIRALIRITKR